MRKVLREKRAYIDTNVFIYVATKHPRFYDSSYKVLKMLVDGEFIGYGSKFIVFELFGALSRINPIAAYEAAYSYLNLPIKLLDMDRETLKLARDIAEESNTTYDAIHAAIMMKNGISTIVTEDIDDWSRIQKSWAYVAKKNNIEIDTLDLFVPSKLIKIDR